jgi:lipoate-protein ligase A
MKSSVFMRMILCAYDERMHLLDLTLPSAAENLALDEALLLEAESGRGGEVLRLWEWPHYAVVLGAGGVLADDVDEAACCADAVPILRRASGGGTVLLGPGCLCYSLVLSYERGPALREITPSYIYILGRIGDALAGLLPGIEHAGTSDLMDAGLKFSGNAQQRKRNHLLHHGTLLYNFDMPRIGRYLRMPGRQPEYRGRREHMAFLRNLPSGADGLKQRLRTGWRAGEEMADWPREAVRRLTEEKYTRARWTRRR